MRADVKALLTLSSTFLFLNEGVYDFCNFTFTGRTNKVNKNWGLTMPSKEKIMFILEIL